jgi:DNA-directed RNA polymerase specialized sigma24 family protein
VAGQPEAVTGVQDPIDPRIMAALMRLPARQRQVIALRVILDLDTSGTARVLGVRPNTVMVHMVRALATLRSDLGFVLEPQQENQ